MYSKIIKRGKKQYKYYYHNFKENGNVRNVLLGSDIKEAQNKLKEIQEKRSSEIKLLAPPSPLYPIRKMLNATNISFLVILVFSVFLLFTSIFNSGITGLAVIEDTSASLNINDFVSQDSSVFLSIEGNEFFKSSITSINNKKQRTRILHKLIIIGCTRFQP